MEARSPEGDELMRGFELNYDDRLQDLIARRTAPVQLTANLAISGTTAGEERYYNASPIFEVYQRLQGEGSAVRYTVGAMARIDPRYTEITYEQGDRVKNQIDKALFAAGASCEFRYQGSVTNDTHIKSYSDIDLLAITQRFWTLEPPLKPSCPYYGDPVADLKEIRSTSYQCLEKAFPTAEVDNSGTKSLTITGGSLSRKIDVVPANWYDTNRYAKLRAERYRAIQVLDVKSGERIVNMPFMHNYLIQELDRSTGGGLRKVIRLMKSLKYDSDSVSLSSYDLASLGYNMPDYQLATLPGHEIPLLARLKEYLDNVAVDTKLRTEMLVPDESRTVFALGHATLQGLEELRMEVDDLVEAVRKNLHKSARKLLEARMVY
jgi:hypothetical protein